ncbi:hypothetical protein GUITHDRAFT_153058 [Guillardia theta CCMP2712]|uniref:Uncharacterized protein n=1 Tax=Guillardia theta (strain CCMP2712) TaxID=905079 RepID=L1J7M1_GUITC|nr:hypothetical protein GUITHDRAFT_153058 [Guillardia theta CCMP2712]EKX44104.1 hypothetical protein GUITHDRAFT_153058 [Guillardia theta CCMP2712]|eukprot:XP_005831084.1 hypothetical protein GUITHDRAFT_153058 [Guillardia theta CCMP2712]
MATTIGHARPDQIEGKQIVGNKRTISVDRLQTLIDSVYLEPEAPFEDRLLSSMNEVQVSSDSQGRSAGSYRIKYQSSIKKNEKFTGVKFSLFQKRRAYNRALGLTASQ